MRITRPVNCVIAGLSIWIAALLARPIVSPWPVLWAIISGTLITAAANVINDWFDIDIDRVNRPQRVLPAGELSRQFALWFAIILFVCGNFFSIFINKFAVLLAVGNSFLLIAYSAWFKRRVLWGNIIVSLVTGLAFIYGANATGRWSYGIIPAIFAFLFHFGREIIKDLEDVKGDAAANAATLPIRCGNRVAYTAVTAIYLVLIAATVIPYFMGIYNLTYLLLVIVGVDALLLVVLGVIWWRQEKSNWGALSVALKLDMLVGLAAIYLGR
jgi:geranylgeranylglycerol-phosphate geranylgeranyltransferase